MSTLAQIRSRIADEVNRNDLSSQIDQAINDAIEYYAQKEDFWFEEKNAIFSTIIGQESYTTADALPSDIGDIDIAILNINSNNKQPLTQRTFDWIKYRNTGVSRGQPTDYSWYGGALYLYLIPNIVQTITLYYTRTYSTLLNDSDTNDYTTYATKLILQRAKWDIYDNILKDSASADRVKIHELDALAALRERSSQLTMVTDVIQSTQY